MASAKNVKEACSLMMRMTHANHAEKLISVPLSL
jgi:hypothetical protein